MLDSSRSPRRLRAGLVPIALLALGACSRPDPGGTRSVGGPASANPGQLATRPCKKDFVSPARARELVDSGAVLLDVRTPEEFAAGHIDGALNIPHTELKQRLSEVPAGKPVVTYCRSGRRSGIAERILEKDGREAHNLGGMDQWNRKDPC